MLKSKPLLFLAVLATAVCAHPSITASLRQVKWEDLAPAVVNKTVSIALRDGAVVSGKALRVEPEAMVVQVNKTSDRKAHPKGSLRIPRAGLQVLELETKRHIFRVILTPMGLALGFVGGVAAAWTSNAHSATAAGLVIGIPAIAAAGGYFLGNAADRHMLTIEILQ